MKELRLNRLMRDTAQKVLGIRLNAQYDQWNEVLVRLGKEPARSSEPFNSLKWVRIRVMLALVEQGLVPKTSPVAIYAIKRGAVMLSTPVPRPAIVDNRALPQTPWLATSAMANEFYKSYAWRKLRYETFLSYGRHCMCCGMADVPMHVDHIKPLRRYWHLRLDPNNVQVLCEECNHGKGRWDETDYRPNDCRVRVRIGSPRLTRDQ